MRILETLIVLDLMHGAVIVDDITCAFMFCSPYEALDLNGPKNSPVPDKEIGPGC